MRRLLLVILALGCAREPVQSTVEQKPIAQPSSTYVESLAPPSSVSTTGEASRNIFAYRETQPPVLVAQKAPAPMRVVTQAPQSVQDVMPAPQPEAPPFGYRCLGTFGSDAHRFAVFTNGEAVVNVAVGEAVGSSQFVLREIGLESVTVAASTFTKRIEIGR